MLLSRVRRQQSKAQGLEFISEAPETFFCMKNKKLILGKWEDVKLVDFLKVHIFNEVTIPTLPVLKCFRLVSERSNNLPFKMNLVGFRGLKSHLY